MPPRRWPARAEEWGGVSTGPSRPARTLRGRRPRWRRLGTGRGEQEGTGRRGAGAGKGPRPTDGPGRGQTRWAGQDAERRGRDRGRTARRPGEGPTLDGQDGGRGVARLR